MEDHLYNNFGDRTEQQIEMKSDLEFLDSRAFENMVTDLENFNEKFAQMSIKQKTSYFVSYPLLNRFLRLSAQFWWVFVTVCCTLMIKKGKRKMGKMISMELLNWEQ